MNRLTSSYPFLLLLAIINFCDNTYETLKVNANKMVDAALEGYVIYYALYSKEDKHCAVLYDYRSFWKRLYLTIYKFIWIHVLNKQDFGSSYCIFKYENVVENVDNLSSFFVDCAVVSYIKEQQIHDELLTCEVILRSESPSTSKSMFKFVYAVMNDGCNDHDFTQLFNTYANQITATNRLTCLDLMIVLCKVSKKENIDLSNFTLKCMVDNTFQEIVFKDNDTISSKLIT